MGKMPSDQWRLVVHRDARADWAVRLSAVPTAEVGQSGSATMAWLTLCRVFEWTYFRPLTKVIDGSRAPYVIAVACGTRLMRDVFLPSMFALCVSLVLAFCVALRKSEPDAPSRGG